MLPELLHSTRIRIARENTPGSGVAAGPWQEMPVTGAAVDREIIASAERRNVHGQVSNREIISDAWAFRTAHEVNMPWLLWMLEAHMTVRSADQWTLDPENEGATFVVETTSEGGSIAAYLGVKLSELQLFWEERRVLQAEASWIALRRVTLDAELPGATAEPFAGPMMPTRLVNCAIATGAWGANPRVDNSVVIHGGQLAITRQIRAVNFGPDGIPDEHSREQWNCVGELFMPETAGITDVAFADAWAGRIAIWIGTGSEHFRVEAAHGIVSDEDLKAYDWRVRRLVFEGTAGNSRTLLEFRA